MCLLGAVGVAAAAQTGAVAAGRVMGGRGGGEAAAEGGMGDGGGGAHLSIAFWQLSTPGKAGRPRPPR